MYTACRLTGYVRLSLQPVLLAFVLVLFAGSVSFAQEARTWTDSTGKFTIIGKIASHDGTTLRIEKSDGTVVAIPIDKLSKSDQFFLSKSGASPLQPDDAKPFQPASAAAMKDNDDNPAPATEPAEANEPRLLSLNYDGIRKVEIEPQQEKFIIEPTPFEAVRLRRKPIVVPPTFDFFDQFEGMEVSANGRVLLSYECELDHVNNRVPLPETPGASNLIHMVLADGVSGRILSEAHQLGGHRVLALHDDGILFAVRKHEFGVRDYRFLEIWAFNGPKSVVRGVKFLPFGDLPDERSQNIVWARFVGDYLFVGQDKRMIAFDVKTWSPQYEVQISGVPTATPDRKHLIYWYKSQLTALEIATGKIVCTMQFDSNTSPALGVDPTGKYLVCANSSELSMINLQSGEIETQFPIRLNIRQDQGVIVLNERYVLTSSGALCDMQTQIQLWEFAGAARINHLGNMVVFYKSEADRNNGALVCEALPGSALSAHLAKKTAKPDFFLVQSGVNVRLDVDGITDAQKREEVIEMLTQKLQANGNPVDPKSSVILKASIESRGPKAVTYGRAGTVTIQEFYSKLEFVSEGKTAWQTGSTNIPGMIRVDPREGLAAVAAKFDKPNYYLFESAILPPRVAKPSDKRELGKTFVGLNGLK